MKHQSRAGQHIVFGMLRFRREMRKLGIFQIPDSIRHAAEELGYTFNKEEGYADRIRDKHSILGSDSLESNGVR